MMSSMLLRSLSGEREDVEGCEEVNAEKQSLISIHLKRCSVVHILIYKSKRNPDISVSNLCDLSILDEETILETLDR